MAPSKKVQNGNPKSNALTVTAKEETVKEEADQGLADMLNEVSEDTDDMHFSWMDFRVSIIQGLDQIPEHLEGQKVLGQMLYEQNALTSCYFAPVRFLTDEFTIWSGAEFKRGLSTKEKEMLLQDNEESLPFDRPHRRMFSPATAKPWRSILDHQQRTLSEHHLALLDPPLVPALKPSAANAYAVKQSHVMTGVLLDPENDLISIAMFKMGGVSIYTSQRMYTKFVADARLLKQIKESANPSPWITLFKISTAEIKTHRNKFRFDAKPTYRNANHLTDEQLQAFYTARDLAFSQAIIDETRVTDLALDDSFDTTDF